MSLEIFQLEFFVWWSQNTRRRRLHHVGLFVVVTRMGGGILCTLATLRCFARSACYSLVNFGQTNPRCGGAVGCFLGSTWIVLAASSRSLVVSATHSITHRGKYIAFDLLGPRVSSHCTS